MIDVCFLQIRESFKNLKFLISFLIIIALFIINALFFSFKIENRFLEYNNIVNENTKANSEYLSNLNNLVFKDHLILKKPYTSEFIINGNQYIYPDGMTLNVMEVNLPDNLYYQNQGLIKLPPIDWFFIISIILSFLIFILTYDSISGEKEKGTFKIVFSNSISKFHYLLGKIIGVSISVLIPLIFGIILNIFIVMIFGKINIDIGLLTKIFVLVFYSIFYILFFVTLGMLISFITNNSLKSLIICSLLWITFVVVIPITVKISVTNLFKVPSKNDLAIQLKEADSRIVEFLSKHDAGARGPEAGKIDGYKKEKGEALANNELAELKQKIKRDFMSKKIRQAELFYSLSSISPVYLYQVLLERLFGTGLQRDKFLYQQSIEFQNQLINFYKQMDEKDPFSPHIYFLKNYLSNNVEIDPNKIPKFEERLIPNIIAIQKSSMVFAFLLFEYLIILGLMCKLFEKAVLV